MYISNNKSISQNPTPVFKSIPPISGSLTPLEKSDSKNSESINLLNKFVWNESSNHDTNAKETVLADNSNNRSNSIIDDKLSNPLVNFKNK